MSTEALERTADAEKAATGTGLSVFTALTPETFTIEGAQKIVADLRREILTIDRDISTEKGRKAIASMARKIATSKTAADEFGKKLKAEYKAKVDGIDAIRRVLWDGLEALQKEFRKPLDDFEAAEKARVAGHEAALAAIVEAPGYGQTETAADIRARLEHLKAYPARDWQEFAARAEKTLAAEIERTEVLLAIAEKREAEQAELERLRQEEAARRQREHEARIAEQARAEAEARARQEAEEAARLAEAERQRVEQERIAAEQRAAQAEADRLEAERRAQEIAQRAEADRIAAAEKAEADRIAAEERAKQEAADAVERERQRIEDERRAEEAEAQRRAADREHRARVNRAALEAFVAAGLPEDMAKAAVEAIARKAIPHVAITY